MKSAVNRRQLFRLGAGLASAPAILSAQSSPEPRSIIYMVSDGMSAGVIPMAEAFSHIARGKGTAWTELLRNPEVTRGFVDMASLNSLVTDSSAASSSWGSGSRIFNAMLNVLPDGTKMTPIGWLARDKGKKLGLVTTATVTHATPAGFAAVSPRRDDEESIATQYLDKVDVILGGGRKFFVEDKRKDKKNLAGAYREADYQVSFEKKDLKPAPGKKLLGLYDDGHVPYSIDRRAEKKLQQNVPTLAEMARAALTSLDSAPNGFLLQIEGARVDHAAHANDAAAQMWDQLAFDDAIHVVLEYVQKRPDTLVVITSDHGNANPGIYGVGKEYEHSNEFFTRLTKAKYSFTTATKRLGSAIEYKGLQVEPQRGTQKPIADMVKQVVQEDFGFDLTDEEARVLRLAIGRGQMLSVNKQLDNLPGILGQVLGNHNGVGWMATTHSSDYTISTAFGPGASQFNGLIRNTDVFVKLTRLMGIDFRNPSMDVQKSLKYVASIPRRDRVDWA